MYLLFVSSCRNAPVISVTYTYIPSFASMAQESIIAFSNTVGELVSDFVVYSLCDVLISTSSRFDGAVTFFFQEHKVFEGYFPLFWRHVLFS